MKLRLLVLCGFLMSLTSCFDIYETFDLKEDGSGVYEQKMDFTRMMSFASMMKGANQSGKEPQKKDTVISFRSVVDTMANLTAEEKSVMAGASMNIHMDEAAGQMVFVIRYPFANARQFQLVQQVMARDDNNKTMMAAMGAAIGQQPKETEGGEEKKPNMPTNHFTYILTPNSLVKKVKPSSKPEEAAAPKTDMPAEFKEMMKMSFTTVINLPRPVKTWSGNNGTLSADKKQLKFNKQMDMDVKLTPADFDFSVEF